jgi:hypothetical protein
MNFDTRTVIDIISINKDLKDKLCGSIDSELLELSYESPEEFTDEDLFVSLKPIFQAYISRFFKNDLKNTDLAFVKKLINLKNINYRVLIDEVKKM